MVIRITAGQAPRVVEDRVVVLRIRLQTGEVRFGLSKFRIGSDPRGGYVRVPIDDYTTSHATSLSNAFEELEGET